MIHHALTSQAAGSEAPGTTPVTEIVLPGLVEPAGLQIRHRVLPAPSKGEALVQVEASGVSFAEKGMRRGKYPGMPTFPFVPGYDFVGTVRAVGPGVPAELVGQRVAAVNKIGGWATHLVIAAELLVPVPAELDPALVETVLVNGVTAWQMLHRKARVKAGQTILVHGANGGVGTVLGQLAVAAGIRVIGTAAPQHHEALRASGVEPVDYHAAGLEARLRALAPDGFDAAFDHVGLDSARMSMRLLAPGGSLVAYGNAALLDAQDAMLGPFVRLVGQIMWWKLLPNSHYVTFYDFWGGSRLTPRGFRRALREDLTELLGLLSKGAIRPPIAARFPLAEAAAAMVFAESRTVQGKVVLVP